MNKKDGNKNPSVLKTVGNIVSWTFLVLLILVASFLMYYVITSQIYASKGTGKSPKFSLYTIISPSMTPNINVYDVVMDKRVDSTDDIEVGDVITFISTSSISNGLTITHRVVSIVETDEGIKYKTQGDNNLTPDYALVSQDKIIGKVIFRIPQLGRLQFLLSSKGGWLLLILIPALILILADVTKLFKIFKLKTRVTTIKKVDDDSEEVSQEQLILEHKRKAELKKKLEEKNAKTKYKKGKYESKDIVLEPLETHISIDRDDELSRTQSINLDALEELRNKILEEDIPTEEVPEEEKGFIEEYIVPEVEPEDNDTYNEFVKNNTFEDNNVFGEIIAKYEEPTEIDPISDIEEDIKEINYEEILKNINELDDLEMPKKIEIKEEVIPDDLDLPTIISDEEKEEPELIDDFESPEEPELVDDFESSEEPEIIDDFDTTEENTDTGTKEFTNLENEVNKIKVIDSIDAEISIVDDK